jgi:hypothetical protein
MQCELIIIIVASIFTFYFGYIAGKCKDKRDEKMD